MIATTFHTYIHTYINGRHGNYKYGPIVLCICPATNKKTITQPLLQSFASPVRSPVGFHSLFPPKSTPTGEFYMYVCMYVCM